jgi:hypothetical protein
MPKANIFEQGEYILLAQKYLLLALPDRQNYYKIFK